MRKFIKILFANIISLSLFLIGITIILAQLNISLIDEYQITENLNNLVQAINVGDQKRISTLISPNNQSLILEIQERIKGGITYRLDYVPLKENLEILSQNKVKIKAKFTASGANWNISGFPTYFIFEKQNLKWLITETDFHKKLGGDYVFEIVKWIFIFVVIIFFILFAFWVWMLIDCVKREFKDKALWIIVLLFFNFMGAILYFFIVKRKNITRQ